MQLDFMKTLSRTALTALAAGLALTLTACGSSGDSTELPQSEPLATLPPPAGKAWSDVVEATPEDGMRMGNPDAPIKLVEYGSLSCPHCARFSRDGHEELVSKYVDSGRVSYEFHSYAIHGVIDLPLTVMVRCSSPEAFFPLVTQLYATQDQWMGYIEKNSDKVQQAASLPPDKRYIAIADSLGLTDWFAARGVSVDQSHACLSKPEELQKVADDTQKWFEKDGINSTPTLLINGAKTNVATWAEIEPMLQNAGAR